MSRTPLAVLAVAFLTGCAGSSVESPSASESGSKPAQLAAAAAGSPYPSTQATPAPQLGAVYNRDNHTIRILNFSDQQVKDGKVWINGTFVHPIQSIPPHGMVTLDTEKFYGSAGRPMRDLSVTPANVQIQVDNSLYNVQGPLLEK